MPRHPPFRRFLALALALCACARALGVEGVRVRPSAGAATRAGRRGRIAAPHDGFGARPKRVTDDARARDADERRRMMARDDALRVERLRERRREESVDGTRRRRLASASDGTASSDDGAVEEGVRAAWMSLDDAMPWAVCDGCKLTARGLHADAVVAARTTPQSSWRALDASLRSEVVALVWRETTCERFKNVTAVRRDAAGRLVDMRDDTRHSEITNPAEARLRPEENVDAYAVSVLTNVCELLREDPQARDWMTGALVEMDDVRPMRDEGARRLCDKLSADEQCTARVHSEL